VNAAKLVDDHDCVGRCLQQISELVIGALPLAGVVHIGGAEFDPQAHAVREVGRAQPSYRDFDAHCLVWLSLSPGRGREQGL